MMTEILGSLFSLATSSEIGKICYLLQGRVAPLFEAVEFGVAEKFIIRSIAEAYGVGEDIVLKEFKRTGDLGTAAQACYHVLEHDNKKRWGVREVYERLHSLTRESGEGSQEEKVAILAELLKDLDRLSVRYVVRIPLDKLRLGFSDVTILDSLSWMLAGDKSLREKLEDVYNVRPDIGFLAETVKTRGLEGLSRVRARVGVPILAALCQRLPTADEIIKKMGKVAVEPKYDGVRVQIHYEKTVRVKTFSRNLENTTAMFPELLEIAGQLDARQVILDGEAIGVDPKTGKLFSFQETMTRKRKHDIKEARRLVPLKFFIFDILYKDGEDVLNKPLSVRRNILEEVVKEGKILTISPQIVTSVPDEILRFYDERIKRGLEGVVVKKWDSSYEPGRRGYNWVKFKEEEGKTGKLTDTIDAVVMGYYRGEGKRTGFGIGAFLVGVRDRESFVTLTKTGTGVTDEQWKELRRRLNTLKVGKQPKEYRGVEKIFLPDVWVAPKLVVEIAGDDLTKSPTHGAGIAVRFPRLVGIRDDKSPEQATTVAELKRMYQNQKSATKK